MAELNERLADAAPTTPLTPTGRVILGMVALGKQTGYDIKQLVDQFGPLLLGGELRPDLSGAPPARGAGALSRGARSRRVGARGPSTS